MLQDYRLVFVVALATALVLTPTARAIARRYGLVAQPKADRWHRKPTALMGGIAVVIATLLVAAWTGFDGPLGPVLLGATAMFVVGAVDDLVGLRPATKLAAQIAAAAVVVSQGGGLEWAPSATAAAVFSIFWFVAITNAFNLLDNMDGLCAGIGLIAAVTLGITGADAAPGLVVIAAALSGALLGFLVYNFSPASIFLGDSGSLFVGFLLAGLAASPSEEHTSEQLLSVLAVPVLILAIPILDTALVTVLRKLSGRAASQGGTDHLSHRLVALGFPDRTAVLLLYGLAAAAGATAVLVRAYGVDSVGPLIVLLLTGLVLLGVALARVRVYQDADLSVLQNSRYTPLLTELAYRRRVFEVMLDLVLISAAYYGAYRLRFEGSQFAEEFPGFIATLPIAMATKTIAFWIAGVYRGVWRYAGLTDLYALMWGALLGSVALATLTYFWDALPFTSSTVFIIDFVLVLVVLVGSRLSFRALGEMAYRHRRPVGRPALLYGAGDGGATLLREIEGNPKHGFHAVGFLDDDHRKHGRKIRGYFVFGGIEALEDVVADRHVSAIIVSAGVLDPEVEQRLVGLSHKLGLELVRLRFALEPVTDADGDEARRDINVH
ncbi:MAG: glycosyl transferase [Acidimicrobiia bacterium]|nr:glycosyl transferase [Acidimicrobiia bacterium]